jgi:hypothetical protein
VKSEERQLILQEHNRLRSWVASGNEARGLGDGAPQPPAANMMSLVLHGVSFTFRDSNLDTCGMMGPSRGERMETDLPAVYGISSGLTSH